MHRLTAAQRALAWKDLATLRAVFGPLEIIEAERLDEAEQDATENETDGNDDR